MNFATGLARMIKQDLFRSSDQEGAEDESIMDDRWR